MDLRCTEQSNNLFFTNLGKIAFISTIEIYPEMKRYGINFCCKKIAGV